MNRLKNTLSPMRIAPNVKKIQKINVNNTLNVFVGGLLIALLLPVAGHAAHIVGGGITYECLGTGQYRFTMKIYRDCAGNGAPFDGAPGAPFPARLTVYEGDSQFPFSEPTLGAPVITQIDPNEQNPCVIVPPNVCIQEGVYVWTLNLPVSDEPYHIVYQRCCRNNTINNIQNPGDEGATYRVTIEPLAQNVCNNSPTFDEFPPVVICAGEPLNVDFSVTDTDGDQLVYSLCSPIDGGGPDTQNDTAPNGVAPQPDLPPPFDEVNFINPPYSTLGPLNADPGLAMDPVTGFLSGTPQTLGQFVLGVCVEEYRNGQLIGTIFRDLQFNVAFCEPLVEADINESEIITLDSGEEVFVVTNCGGTVVDFDNQSTQEQFISEYRWEFDIAGATETFTTRDLTVDFGNVGVYPGQLMVNPGTSCGDTLDIRVNIFPDISADFDFEYDTCVAGPTTFTDLSVADAGPDAIDTWLWNFGDGNVDTVRNPIHTYAIPGILPVALTVRDTNGCAGTTIQPIAYQPAPATIIIAPNSFIGCVPADIFFNNLSVPIDSTYDIEWTFGDGGTSTAISPTHRYDSVGVFTVSIDITSPIGCKVDTTLNGLIETRESPLAGFRFTPEEPSNLQPVVDFIDESERAVRWDYFADDFLFSNDPNPRFNFRDTGSVLVTQIVTHPNGCQDTAFRRVDIIPIVTYHMPNAFTPNNDGVNDVFFGQGVLEGSTDFQFQIWNRYGELIYETFDFRDEGWNGRKDNVGPLLAAGVYVVTVQYREPRGKLVRYRGFATLVK